MSSHFYNYCFPGYFIECTKYLSSDNGLNEKIFYLFMLLTNKRVNNFINKKIILRFKSAYQNLVIL